MRPHRLLFSSVLLLTVGGLVPLFGDSVYVSNGSSGPNSPGFTVDGTTIPYCQQSGTSSASCGTSFSGHGGGLFYSTDGMAYANAAFGALSGQLNEGVGSSGRFVSSFGDDVIVTGGAGSGTLVADYSLSAAADNTGSISPGPNAGSFSFVQGSTKTGVTPSFTNFGYTPPQPNPPPPGCNPYGLCFSETFDVTSPIQFGTALSLGAETDFNSKGFNPGEAFRDSFFDANASVNLTRYTVLDGSGNVISDAVVTRQNVPGLDLFPAPEPGTWALMLAGLGMLAGWQLRRRRGLLFSLAVVSAVCGAIPVWANSVTVSAYSYPDPPIAFAAPFTGSTQCVNSGTSSASCESYFSSVYYSRIGGYASAYASAASGLLEGQVFTSEFGTTYSRAVASFGDDVIVTGGTGTGTLISHYTAALAAESNYGTPEAGGFAFVQGVTRSGVTPTQFANFGFSPPFSVPPPAGCEYVGLCFSESFDVSSPISFGSALPLGALSYLNSDGFGQISGSGGSYVLRASSLLRLDGYTVLDASGNVISDAVVTPQNVPGLNLDFTPEPGTWALMLAGLGGLAGWARLRRNGKRV